MKKIIIVTTMIIVLVLQGCARKDENNVKGEDDSDTQAVDNSSAGSVDTEETDASPAATPTTAVATTPPVQLVLPVTVNETGKVLIQTVSASPTYKTTSYIITSAEGESVVVDPTSMPKKDIVDINPAAIVNTHNHPDHTDASYVKDNQTAQLITYEEGDIKTKDFHIYTVTSSHNGDTINGSNYIIVFEVDGLRIAHMGDVGQTSLTEEQLAAIGKIDIAFMQFENSYSDMSVDNGKGFTMIEQLKPKIVIPTHYSDKSRVLLEEKYGTITVVENLLEISVDDLPETELNVYEMTNSHKYR